jgi:rubrerythrin
MAEATTGYMTKGVLNALGKSKYRTLCKECGFPLPVYPGRYPSKCPHCGAPRNEAVPEEDKDA